MNKIEKLMDELCPEGVAFKDGVNIVRADLAQINMRANTPMRSSYHADLQAAGKSIDA